jgi:hypothetical protein
MSAFASLSSIQQKTRNLSKVIGLSARCQPDLKVGKKTLFGIERRFTGTGYLVVTPLCYPLFLHLSASVLFKALR